MTKAGGRVGALLGRTASATLERRSGALGGLDGVCDSGVPRGGRRALSGPLGASSATRVPSEEDNDEH